MDKKLKPLGWLIMIFPLFLTVSCTKEKAEAIKIGAENFRMEAVEAVKKINFLLIQSISMPAESADAEIQRVAAELEKEEAVNASRIGFLIRDKDIGQRPADRMNQEFEKIEKGYYQFAAMFRSLPQGSYFARDAVKRAEKSAIQLTLQLMNFAGALKDYPVQFTARRVLLQERAKEAKQIKDSDSRRRFLTIVAGDLLRVRDEEEGAKKEAIAHCLNAAESGRLVADLIRNYDAMNVEDMLASVGNTLGFISEISGGQRDVISLLETYKTVEAQIREDPYWKEVLSLKIPE